MTTANDDLTIKYFDRLPSDIDDESNNKDKKVNDTYSAGTVTDSI